MCKCLEWFSLFWKPFLPWHFGVDEVVDFFLSWNILFRLSMFNCASFETLGKPSFWSPRVHRGIKDHIFPSHAGNLWGLETLFNHIIILLSVHLRPSCMHHRFSGTWINARWSRRKTTSHEHKNLVIYGKSFLIFASNFHFLSLISVLLCRRIARMEAAWVGV